MEAMVESLLDCIAEPTGPDMSILASDMTLRDHFAGLALQGMLAHNPLFASPEVAYQKADLMMKVRNETR